MSNYWINHYLDLGHRTFAMEWFYRPGKEKKHVLITAGMDGDEVAGIAAARALSSLWEKEEPPCAVTIIPVVNVPGYEARISWNPLDGKYPKSCVTVSEPRTPTQKLVHWLFATHVAGKDFWIDLHGGSTPEVLTPFLWTNNTENVQTNEYLLKALHAVGGVGVIQKNNMWNRAVPHIVVECGWGGEIHDGEVSYHHDVVTSLLQYVATSSTVTKQTHLYEHVYPVTTNIPGVWHTKLTPGCPVTKNQKLGSIVRSKGSTRAVYAPSAGVVLYHRQNGTPTDIGDEVATIFR